MILTRTYEVRVGSLKEHGVLIICSYDTNTHTWSIHTSSNIIIGRITVVSNDEYGIAFNYNPAIKVYCSVNCFEDALAELLYAEAQKLTN